MKKNEAWGLRTWIEINTDAIGKNYRAFRNFLSPKTKLMAVVKSNAYGHGLVEFSRQVVACGADWLGVDSIIEALTLRREGVSVPILVLGYTLPERFAEAADHDISISISNREALTTFGKIALSRPLKIHIKVDTGMHRLGFLLSEKKAVMGVLKKLQKSIVVEGLFTHFAAAKNPAFPAYTEGQIAVFEEWKRLFNGDGYTPIIHASATAGALVFPQAHYDMVRIGIGMYGLWPAREIEAFCADRIDLLPVLSWKTVIAETKKVPKGSKIGYDCTEVLSTDAVIAICPVGYWHGYPRALSSIGHVLVNGVRCRVLGRVSMDMLVIDVSKAGKVIVGTEVVLIGKSDKEEISIEYLSGLIDMSWYEFVTRINPLMKRIYR